MFKITNFEQVTKWTNLEILNAHYWNPHGPIVEHLLVERLGFDSPWWFIDK